MRNTSYVLGHAEPELARLARQAALIGPVTRALLVEAGVRPGMRVLDVGTGRGDVAFLAAELVGPEGSVVGIDIAPSAVAVARERAAGLGLGNVTFRAGDPAALDDDDGPFDAVVGRYVLLFIPNPGETLRRLAGRVVPGGVIAFHEIDWSLRRSVPAIETWDRCCDLVTDALTAGGADIRLGPKLPGIFVEAGLDEPSLRLSAIVGGGGRSDDVILRLVSLFTTLRPRLIERGVIAPDELDPGSLEEQLRTEIAERHAFVQAATDVTAWTRLRS
jgi:SAM-dependent methyltransferase